MSHTRHWTVEEADAALEWLEERLARMRGARAALNDEEARAALSEAGPTNGGGAPGRTVSAGFVGLRDALAELAAAGILLRDLDRGLVDFPAIRDGREVYLCWEEGEPSVAFWHETSTGYGGRRPL